MSTSLQFAIALWATSPYPIAQTSLWAFAHFFGTEPLPRPLKRLAQQKRVAWVPASQFGTWAVFLGAAEVALLVGIPPTDPIADALTTLQPVAVLLWLLWLGQLYWRHRIRSTAEEHPGDPRV
jgi:hypothetical protein